MIHLQIKIDASDLKKLQATLDKIEKQAPEDLEKLFKDTTSEIEADAKLNAPVGVYPPGSNRVGGWLRKNIKKFKDSTGYGVKSGAEYSLWVEYGNRWWSGKPFFRPAIEKGIKYMEQEIKHRFKY